MKITNEEANTRMAAVCSSSDQHDLRTRPFFLFRKADHDDETSKGNFMKLTTKGRYAMVALTDLALETSTIILSDINNQ